MWEWIKTNRDKWPTYFHLAERSGWGEDTLKSIQPSRPDDDYTLLVFSDQAKAAARLRASGADHATQHLTTDSLNMLLARGDMVPALTRPLPQTKSGLHTPVFSSFHMEGADAAPHRWMVFPAAESAGSPFNVLAMVNGQGQFVHVNLEVKEVFAPDGVPNFKVVVLAESLLKARRDKTR